MVLDITGIDIAAIVTGFGSLGGCIAAGVKAIKAVTRHGRTMVAVSKL